MTPRREPDESSDQGNALAARPDLVSGGRFNWLCTVQGLHLPQMVKSHASMRWSYWARRHEIGQPCSSKSNERDGPGESLS